MSERTAADGRFGFEVFGTTAGLAVVVGALSVVVPYFLLLTGSLVALGVAGWASLRPRGRRPRRGPDGARRAAGRLSLVAGAVVFLLPPLPLAPWRGLLLGLSAAAFWAAERATHVPAPFRRRWP